MNRPLRLSVLDQSPVSEGSSAAQALRNTLDLARLADELGYHRYWVAEHHGGPMLAGPSPEALIGPIAAGTERIRVGSGGVMLPHYSPLKVAETFSLLSGLFPGRIDLGLGRAAGTDPMTAFALQRDRRQAPPMTSPNSWSSCWATSRTGSRRTTRSRALAKTLPGLPERPEPWLLGSSRAERACGPPSSVCPTRSRTSSTRGAPRSPRSTGNASPSTNTTGRSPRTAVAVWVICADTDEEARRIATSGRMAFTLLRQGRLIAVPPPERAERFLATQQSAPGEPGAGRRAVLGAPDTVRAQLTEVVDAYGAEEAIVVCITYEHQAPPPQLRAAGAGLRPVSHAAAAGRLARGPHTRARPRLR